MKSIASRLFATFLLATAFPAKAQDEVTAMCDALLANTVIERYEVELL